MTANTLPSSLSRRRLLQGMGILSVAAVCNSLFPQRALAKQQMADNDFMVVSQFLTHRSLSPLLGQRYYQALLRHHTDFPPLLAELAKTLALHHFTHVDDFLAATPQTDAMWQTAKTIISAWYTGLVGEGNSLELIAYADAIMYQPTKDILVVPTYGGGPFYWAVTQPGHVALSGVKS